jgi:hypothetical protein
MKAALVRAVVGGSVATALWVGLTLALGVFTILEAVAFGLVMACIYAALPWLLRFGRRSAKAS